MGNLISMRGGFLGQPTSGGATQREKDSSPADRFRVIAARAFVRFVSMPSSYNTIHRVDISAQDSRARGEIARKSGLKSRPAPVPSILGAVADRKPGARVLLDPV